MPPREACWACATLDSCLVIRLEESRSEYRPRRTGAMTAIVTTASIKVKPAWRRRRALACIAEPHEDGLLGLAESWEGAQRRAHRHGDLLDRVDARRGDAGRQIGGVL